MEIIQKLYKKYGGLYERKYALKTYQNSPNSLGQKEEGKFLINFSSFVLKLFSQTTMFPKAKQKKQRHVNPI